MHRALRRTSSKGSVLTSHTTVFFRVDQTGIKKAADHRRHNGLGRMKDMKVGGGHYGWRGKQELGVSMIQIHLIHVRITYISHSDPQRCS